MATATCMETKWNATTCKSLNLLNKAIEMPSVNWLKDTSARFTRSVTAC